MPERAEWQRDRRRRKDGRGPTPRCAIRTRYVRGRLADSALPWTSATYASPPAPPTPLPRRPRRRWWSPNVPWPAVSTSSSAATKLITYLLTAVVVLISTPLVGGDSSAAWPLDACGTASRCAWLTTSAGDGDRFSSYTAGAGLSLEIGLKLGLRLWLGDWFSSCLAGAGST